MWSRESRHKRGYGTEWDKLRAHVLSIEPLCRSCHSTGRVNLAQCVDHIKPKADGGTDDQSNLQPLCNPCHAAKTKRENGATERPTIGADGWPLPAGFIKSEAERIAAQTVAEMVRCNT